MSIFGLPLIIFQTIGEFVRITDADVVRITDDDEQRITDD